MSESNGTFSCIPRVTSCVILTGIDQFTSHDMELNELQELKETLTELQNKLNKISCKCNDITNTYCMLIFHAVRAHLLNIDLVTQFNPHTVETLNNTISECKKCTEQN